MAVDFLSKHFPSPKFLKPSHIGLSFYDSEIKAVMFDGKPSKESLKSLSIDLEHGAIVEGKVVNSEEVIKKLSAIKKEFKIPYVFFTVPDELAYIFEVDLPVAKEGDMSEQVAFTMEENAPISLSEAVFDFYPTSISKSGGSYEARFVVATSTQKEIEKYIDVLDKSGFEPVGCIHDSQATANALIPAKDKDNSCIMQVSKGRVAIFLVRNRLVHFSTIRSVPEDDYKKELIDEYEKFLEYSIKYDKEGNLQVKNIFVCGDFDYAKKAVEAIVESSASVKNIKLANVWTNILKIEKDAPTVTYEESLGFASSVGAVLSDIT